MLVEIVDTAEIKCEKGVCSIDGELIFKSLQDAVNELVSQYSVGEVIDAINDSDDVLDALDDEEIMLYTEGL